MTGQEIQSLLEKQRTYYRSGVTIPVKFRIEQLKKLYDAVEKYQAEINDALNTDLGKSSYEGFMGCRMCFLYSWRCFTCRFNYSGFQTRQRKQVNSNLSCR